MISRWPTTLVLTAALGMASLSLPSLAFGQAAAQSMTDRSGDTTGPGKGDDGQGPHGWLTEADRAAFFNARLAAVHAGLALTPDQEKLWPAAESAIRDGIRQLREARHKVHEETASDSEATEMGPIARLRRMAELDQVRATVFGKIADAAQPLYASLAPDQKRRLHILMHVMHAHHDEAMGRDHDRDRDQDK